MLHEIDDAAMQAVEGAGCKRPMARRFVRDTRSQAKASVDNGATGQRKQSEADSVAGDASRPSRGGGSPACHSVRDGRPEGGKRLQVLRGPNHAAEPDALLSTREGAGMERGIDQCVTAGETATHSDPHASSSRLADKTGAATPPAAPVANSGGDAIGEVKAQCRLPGAIGVEPSPSEPIKRRHALRPFCQHPYEEACGGYGDRHCTTCRKAMKDAGAGGAEAPASGATDTDTSGGEGGWG